MKRRPGSSWTLRLRRLVQLAVLVLFLVVLVLARPVPGAEPSPLLRIFFDLDPLVALLTAIAGHVLQITALLALAVVLVTIVLGRVFCGWFCPFGTVHAIASRLMDRWRGPRRPEHWSGWQLAKYFVLGVLVTMAIFGVQWLVLLDPLVILYRSTATAVLPGLQGLVEDGAATVYHADPRLGGWKLTSLTEPPYRLLRDHVFVTSEQAFVGGGLILAFFALTIALNAIRRRFWCRYICPLGALLGIFSWRPWLRRRVDRSACNECEACGLSCHGAAADPGARAWKPQECLGCLHCPESCPREGLGFAFAPPWRTSGPGQAAPEVGSINLSRRRLLTSAAVGVAGVIALRANPQARGTAFHPALIRPPGAGPEDEFLSRCIACGLCMKICPTGGLQPSLTEAGLEGLWTPKLTPQVGYCDYECNRCGQVCPTQAIHPLPLEQKKAVRIGLAFIDVSRCLPFAFGTPCLVCEEHCPVAEKAIELRAHAGAGRGRGRGRIGGGDGAAELLYPHVVPDRCTGCGICENVCPFKDRPAIYVTSANESRHPANQPILDRGGSADYPL